MNETDSSIDPYLRFFVQNRYYFPFPLKYIEGVDSSEMRVMLIDGMGLGYFDFKNNVKTVNTFIGFKEMKLEQKMYMVDVLDNHHKLNMAKIGEKDSGKKYFLHLQIEFVGRAGLSLINFLPKEYQDVAKNAMKKMK